MLVIWRQSACHIGPYRSNPVLIMPSYKKRREKEKKKPRRKSSQ